MNMLTQLADGIIYKLRPAAASAGLSAQAFSLRALARLDQIADNTENVAFTEQNITIPLNNVGAGTAQPIINLPADVDWLLESVCASGIAAAGTVLIRENGVLRWRTVADVTAAGGFMSNPNIVFRKSSQITFDASQAITELVFTFKVRQRKPARATITAGTQNLPAELETRSQQLEDMLRHFAPWVGEGINSIGDRAGS